MLIGPAAGGDMRHSLFRSVSRKWARGNWRGTPIAVSARLLTFRRRRWRSRTPRRPPLERAPRTPSSARGLARAPRGRRDAAMTNSGRGPGLVSQPAHCRVRSQNRSQAARTCVSCRQKESAWLKSPMPTMMWESTRWPATACLPRTRAGRRSLPPSRDGTRRVGRPPARSGRGRPVIPHR